MTVTNQHINSTQLKWLMIGLGLGVPAGFLVAPKSGSHTRQFIQSKAAEGVDYIRNETAGVVNTAAGLVDRGTKAIRQQKENLAAAVEAGQVAYREAVASTPGIKSA